ncbi:TniQ family protein [Cyanobacteria bacterium FACHB-471]|nr:TniQ family protein [Cyanobacteria bacterium FACHB-471]
MIQSLELPDDYPWFKYVEPKDGESIASFIHRFRQAKGNRISSPSQLGEILEVGTAINCWENLQFGRKPTQEEVAALSKVTRVETDRLWQMFPPKGERSQPNVIRLCAACYQEGPYHRIAWQLRSTRGCDRHKLKLLMKCPGCETLFPVPSRWVEGKCQNKKCGMRYSRMAKHQAKI